MLPLPLSQQLIQVADSQSIVPDQHSPTVVTTSSWQNSGQLINLRGIAASVEVVQGSTVAKLTSGFTSTSNAFEYRSRLQDNVFFLATFSVLCSGDADAIYFYFGGTGTPVTEGDVSGSACLIGISLYNNLLEINLNDPPVNTRLNYNVKSQTGTWIPMTIMYNRTSDSSFAIRVAAHGSTELSTSVTISNAGSWLLSASSDYWGIGARTGAVTGTFWFKDLEVLAGMLELHYSFYLQKMSRHPTTCHNI